MLPGTDQGPSGLIQLVRNNMLKGLLSVVLLGVLTAVLVTQFRPQLDAITNYTFEHLGLSGVVAVIFLTDAFVSPFPPDSVLILIATSSYHQYWTWLLPLIGVVSTCAGYVGYGCGRLLSTRPWAESLFGKLRKKSQRRIEVYGAWAVALGAMTPIPFSITCWTAGLMRVPFYSVFWPCLLRIPRYVFYYLAIAYSAQAF